MRNQIIKKICYNFQKYLQHPHEVGYAYVINFDTSMYQVYTAKVSKENMSWNIIDDRDATMKRNVFKVVNGKYIYTFTQEREC